MRGDLRGDSLHDRDARFHRDFIAIICRSRNASAAAAAAKEARRLLAAARNSPHVTFIRLIAGHPVQARGTSCNMPHIIYTVCAGHVRIRARPAMHNGVYGLNLSAADIAAPQQREEEIEREGEPALHPINKLRARFTSLDAVVCISLRTYVSSFRLSGPPRQRIALKITADGKR